MGIVRDHLESSRRLRAAAVELPRGLRHGLWHGLATLVAAIAVVGCASPQVREPARPDEAAARQAIASSAASLRRLATFEASGVCRIEVPREDSGFDEEQLDLLLVLERPRKSALRLKLSVSDTLAWLGSDGEQWWLFLPEEAPSIAYRGSIGGEAIASEPRLDQAPVPRSLRDPRLFWLLAGLEPPRDLSSGVAWDAARSAWVVEEPLAASDATDASVGGLLVRRGFDARGDAVFVEVREADGRLLASSVLRDHVSVEIEGVALGAWPRVATRITLEGAMPGEGRAMLVLERPSGRGARVKPALFDWDRLVASMRPERIVEVAP